MKFAAVALAIFFGSASAAEAYIGPGMGAGAIGAVLGVVGAVFLALFAVVYYPIKRMLKRNKPSGAPGAENKTSQ